jgi:rare lipoprotein A
MSSISYPGSSRTDFEANRIHLGGRLVSAAGVRNIGQLFAVALVAALLAACTQSSVATKKTEMRAASRQAPPEQNRKTSFATNRRPAVKNAAETHTASHGLASFYTQGVRTANGEKFDTRELTAAHRTLPFGTRLRVTNVTTGRSVTVRINDRGPFIPGRVVDVSYSAAQSLGMVGEGVAKVKLDVVR